MANRICASCGDAYEGFAPNYCQPCRQARSLFSRYGSGRARAQRLIAQAKGLGHIPPASHFVCVDCANPATDYDHRDYGDPLGVEPVCRGCNLRRGHAQPINWTFEQFLAWAAKSASAHAPRRGFSAHALEHMRRLHFTGPGGVAVRQLTPKQLRAPVPA